MSVENTHTNARQEKINRHFSNTLRTLQQIALRYQEKVNDEHASIVYDEELWRSLQQELTDYVRKRRIIMHAHDADECAAELQHLQTYGIRTAVESFRYEMQNNPRDIHTKTPWENFRENLISTPSK